MEGRDKLELSLGGERLLARIARQLRPHFGDLIAISSRAEAFEGLDYRIIPDTLAIGGPLAGLHAGLKASKSEWVYLVACDMPFFSLPWVETLEARITEAQKSPPPLPIAVAAKAGAFFEPFHAFYSTSFATDIEQALTMPESSASQEPRRITIQTLARSKGVDLVDGIETITASLPLFMNLNTPADIARAEEALRQQPPS